MALNTIDAKMLSKMFLAGAKNLENHKEWINELNVFPVPDGDTGTNMTMTIMSAAREVSALGEEPAMATLCKAISSGSLRGARGNSGVILSQLFYGLAEGLKDHERADLDDFGRALANGVKCAYGAVAVPVEGTILTVAREAAENATKKIDKDISVYDFFKCYLNEMKLSLDRTPEILAVLKESGVIDSGGAGLVYIIEGFCKALAGETFSFEAGQTGAKGTSLDFSKFTEDSEMVFGYCTEMLLQLQKSKTDVDAFKVDGLIEYLSTIGDSIVAFKTGTVVKIHVHTMTPYKVLEYCQQYGEYLTVKIENMTLQHNETVEKKEEPRKIRPHKKYALVTTASGDGLIQLFTEMGADYVINGGQTNNPSSEDFLKAFEEVNADNIFVLPNNGNIILAANQAKDLYDKANIYVIETKSIGQGYSAISVLDYSSDDPEEIANDLKENMQASVTGMIAKSVRTTVANGVSIEKDDYMGFTGKTMLISTKSKIESTKKLIDELSENREFLIMVYGKTTEESDKEAINEYVASNHPELELYEVDGGQDVYDFILIFE